MHATKEYAELNRLETLGLANAGIVHDINNHLMMIVNHLEVGNLHAARYAAKNCASFTASILHFVKARQGPPLRALDLTSIVAANAVSLNIPESISLCLELTSDGAPILGDFTGITRILHNLVSNAVGAIRQMPGGSGTVTISALGRELRITDNGPGIPDRERERLTQDWHYGEGLGLSIVRDLVEQHGAVLTVDSEPGKGTTFRIRFQGAPA